MPCALEPSYLKHCSVLAMVIILYTMLYVIFSPRSVHGSVYIDDSIPS